MPGVLNKVFNVGVKSEFDVEKIRCYRLVNGLNFTFALFAVSMPLFILFGKGLPPIINYIQFACTGLYLSGFFLTYKNKLEFARNFVIFTFEFQVFLLCLLTISRYPNNVIYTSVIFAATLYPILAALVERSILLHVTIALGQVIALYLISNASGSLAEKIISDYTTKLSIPLDIYVSFYLPVMIAVLVSILYRENTKARKLIQEDAHQKEATNNKMADEIQMRDAAEKGRREAEQQLKAKVEELEKLNNYMTGREVKMAELKREIETLKTSAGQ